MLCPSAPRARAALQRLLGITPYEHQAQAAAMMLARFETCSSFGLLHDLGTGKSLTTLGAFLMLHEANLAETFLILCPSSVIGSWEKEVRGVIERSQRTLDVLALTGPVAKREAQLQRKMLERADSQHRMPGIRSAPLIVVTNYEACWRMEATLKAARFSMIACDESQRIKAPGSKQSRAMHRIGKTARYRVVMSGTPVPESPLDWYGQWRFGADELFGTSYANFKARYAVEVDLGTFRKLVGTKNLDELEGKVMSRSHLVTKDQALDLPDETDVIHHFDLSPKARKMYDQLVKDSLVELEDEFGSFGEIVAENVLAKLIRLQQFTGGFASLEETDDLLDIDDGKRKLLTDLISDEVQAGHKFVIFHRFTREGDELRKLADKLVGCSQPHISGAVASGDRAEMIRRFQEDDDARIFVGQIAASGLGITLTASSTTIFYSMGFSGADYEQARARVHRIGQHHPVTHLHLVAKNTVDEQVMDALRSKRKIADDITKGGWRRYLGGQ